MELVDGSLEQNVTAGNAIDEATSTFSIIDAPDQDTPTHDFEYRVAAYTSEKDSIVFNGTISVEQQNFVTT